MKSQHELHTCRLLIKVRTGKLGVPHNIRTDTGTNLMLLVLGVGKVEALQDDEHVGH